MKENLIVEVLAAISWEVWKRDIPSPTCPEYIEHHNDCVAIMKVISEKIDLFRGKSDKEVAEMLMNRKGD